MDEIIRVLENARNDFIALDKATERELEAHEQEFDQFVDGEITDADLGAERPIDRTNSRA